MSGARLYCNACVFPRHQNQTWKVPFLFCVRINEKKINEQNILLTMALVPKSGEVALFSDTRFCIQVFSFLPCLCVPGFLIDWASSLCGCLPATSIQQQPPLQPSLPSGLTVEHGPVTESFPSGCPPELGLWELVLGTSVASSGMKSVFQGFMSSKRWGRNLSFRAISSSNCPTSVAGNNKVPDLTVTVL